MPLKKNVRMCMHVVGENAYIIIKKKSRQQSQKNFYRTPKNKKPAPSHFQDLSFYNLQQ